MFSLLRDIGSFVQAVALQWVSLMGGLIMTVLYLYERNSGQDVSSRLYWSLTAAFVGVAIFLAWRKERQKWERVSLVPSPLTPKEMVAIYKGRTTVHGERLAKMYHGKWIQVIGRVRDVSVDYSDFLYRGPCRIYLAHEAFEEPGIFLYFSLKWVRSVAALSRGEEVTVIGQVRRVTDSFITLKNCELVQVASTIDPQSARDANDSESGSVTPSKM